MEKIYYLALGGVGEFGSNLSLYGYSDKWLMVDCGLSFAEKSMPGIDILVPDTEFIDNQVDKLIGLVLTHAHEDHLGAIPYIWHKIKCPVYATKYTATILRNKLDDAGIVDKIKIRIVDSLNPISIGPFDVRYLPVSHSIIEANSLAIKTPAGLIFHSGDWKIDDDPCIGFKTEESIMKGLSEEGVLAFFGDSTNALSPGISGSEGELRKSLIDIISKCEGRVAVTQFASNAARIESIAIAALESDRELVIVGRSLWKTIHAAQECGYLKNFPNVVDDDEAQYLPSSKVLYLLTGCQGEPRGALSRVASGIHKNIKLSDGDTVIFASKSIPGNEQEIARVTSQLLRKNINIITNYDSFVHVSGHPSRDELVKIIDWIKPKFLIPIHGEYRNLKAHADIFSSINGTPPNIVENGDLVEIDKQSLKVVDKININKFAVTSTGLASLDGQEIKDRKKLMFNGIIIVFLVMNIEGKLLADPNVLVKGMDINNVIIDLSKIISLRINDMPLSRKKLNKDVELSTRQVLRSEFKKFMNQKPSIDIEILRI